MIYAVDCMQVLPTLVDESFDALITDPPFGIGFTYNSYEDRADGYGEWIWSVIEAAERKVKPGGAIFVWQSMTNVTKFASWFPREWRIFTSAKNFVQMRPTAMQYAVDPVLVWWKPGPKPYSAGTLTRDYFVSNTSPSSHKGLNDVKWHPCPRPLDVVRHIVEQWVPPGGSVLDVFAGSGTVGVACALTGRTFLGIEVDREYAQKADERIKQALGSIDG